MEKRPSHFRKWLGHFEETTKPFWKVAKSFLKVTCPFRLFPAKGRPCRRRDAASPPLSHLAFLVISLILAYKFFWKQPEQLVKTTSSFPPRKPRGDLETGRGCARIARVVFISCHGCFLFNETYPHLHSRASAGGGLADNFRQDYRILQD